jgi:hypothetical protein
MLGFADGLDTVKETARDIFIQNDLDGAVDE